MRALYMIAMAVLPMRTVPQCLAPFIALDRSMVFCEGRFLEVDARPPRIMHAMGNGLFFTDQQQRPCRWGVEAKAVDVLQRGPVDAVQASGDRVAWKVADTLWTLLGDRARVMASGVERFRVSDSLIVLVDSTEQELVVYWKGRRIPLAAVSQGSERPQWTQGGNTVCWYDRGQRTLFVFHHGLVQGLVDSSDVGIAVNGTDVIGYWNDPKGEWMGRINGTSVRLSGMKPVSAQAGDRLLAFVDGTLKLKAWRGAAIVQLTDSMPAQYWVKDRVLLYLWGGRLHLWTSDGPVAVEEQVPEKWEVAGDRVVYLDINRELRSLRVDGTREHLGNEPGITGFSVHGEAVVYPSPAGGTVVWCGGRRYVY